MNEQLAPFRLLTGMEVDILEDGSLDLDPQTCGRARCGRGQRPLQVADGRQGHDGAHGGGDREPAQRHPWTLHRAPHHRPGAAAVVVRRRDGLCRVRPTGTAVEINSRPERQDPPEDLLRLAVALGCSFAIDTDAHAPGQLEWLGRGCRNAVTAEVPFERIVNRGTADEVVTWAASHDDARGGGRGGKS